jgi:hypothetical protein
MRRRPGLAQRLFAAVLAWAAAAYLPLAAAQVQDRLGANLNFIADYSRNHEFNDLVKQSRLFLKLGAFDDAQAANRATIGVDGWPTEDFKLFVMTAQAGVSGLDGTYKLIFNGQATLTATGATVSNKTFDAPSNTTRADITFAAANDTLYIDFTGTGGAVKNVRLLRPGVGETSPAAFTNRWLGHLGRFRVLRFMDWTRTNGNRHVNWADRTTPEKAKTESMIARWETVVAATNATLQDAWINIPVLASDEYVTNLAQLLAGTLHLGAGVYVEYGNELWNFTLRDDGMDAFNGGTPFNGATVNRDLAAASPMNSPLRFDGESDPTTLGYRRVALRLKQIGDIFRTVWGPAAYDARVRLVLAGQMSNAFVVSEGLRLIDEGLGIRPHTVIHAIAGAPYIFAAATPSAQADEAAGLTVTQILDGMAAGVANAPNESNAYQYLSHAGLGAWYGVKVMAYEAGFDSFGPNNIANKRLANLHPRIKQICKDYIDQWHAHGFDRLSWFNVGAASFNTEFGMWPLVEDLPLDPSFAGTPDSAPKLKCIDEIAVVTKPAIAIGTPIAAPIAGGNYRGGSNPSGALTGLDGHFGFPGYVEYLLRAEAAGAYDLVFSGNAPSGESFRVKLNNATLAANVALPTSNGNSTKVAAVLREGLNALRIERAVGASWTVSSLAFTPCAGGDDDADGMPNCVEAVEGRNPLVRDNDVFANSRLFAMQQYRDFLGREGDAAGIAFWTGQVNAGLPRANVIENFFTSAEFQDNRAPVVRLYFAYFLRIPDHGGLVFWTNYFRDGHPLAEISNFFAQSPEFVNTYGSLDNAAFVNLVYNNVLGRAPDQGGFDFWRGQLDSSAMTRGQVMLGFSESPEYKSTSFHKVYVTMMYEGMLQRAPDQGGFDFWVNHMNQGNTGLTLINGFLSSPEYHNRFLP